MITQIIIIRELLSVLGGNELIIGICTGSWMLLTGIGALLNKKFENLVKKSGFTGFIQICLSVIPIIIVFCLYFFKNHLLLYGIMPNFIQVLLFSLLLLLPYCLIAGLAFPVFAHFAAKEVTNKVSKIYALETAGGVAGCIIFTFFLSNKTDSWNILLMLAIINLLLGSGYLFFKNNFIYSIIIFAIALIIIPLFNILKIKDITLNMIYPDQQIILSEESSYGKLVVTKQSGQLNYYENGVPIFSSNNVIENEEIIHFGMVQRDSIKDVLMIEGGSGGALLEILKYPVQNIIYTCINPLLIKTGKLSGNIPENNKIQIFNVDGRFFINNTKKYFDMVFVNTSEPSTINLNRFFTKEFFYDIKKKLKPGGIVITSLPSTANYMSNKQLSMHSILNTTLKSVYKNVEIIPASRNYFLASDSVIYINIAEKIMNKNIENQYVNQYYISDISLKEYSETIEKKLIKNADINSDFRPVEFYNQLGVWYEKTSTNTLLFTVIIVAIVFLFIFFLNPVRLGVFSSGLNISSIELLLIMTFQILYGYIYEYIGLLIALCLTGLALGSYFAEKINVNNKYKVFMNRQFMLVLIPLFIVPSFILYSNYSVSSLILFIYISLFSFGGSLIGGLQFGLSTKLQNKKILDKARLSYSADLFGSFAGALIIPLLLIPVWGFVKTCLILSGFNLLCLLIMWLKRNYILIN